MAKILIADDNVQNTYLLTSLLSSEGHEIIQAKNGKEAWNFVQQKPLDIIISDLLMPEMDGFELCRRCKADPKTQKIPFLVYTATYTSAKDERLVIALGADKFLIKPQLPAMILQVVSELLSRKPTVTVKESQPVSQVDLMQAHNEALLNKLQDKIYKLEYEILLRKDAEKSLQKQEQRYRLLTENVKDVVWSTDFHGRPTYVSPSIKDLCGYPPEDFLVDSNKKLIPRKLVVFFGKELARIRKSLKEGSQPDSTGTIETNFKHALGYKILIEVHYGLLFDDNGQVIGVQGVSRDITERRHLEEQLASLHRLESVGRLAGGVAHEFNNMLSVILSYSNLVLEQIPSDSPIRNDLEQIHYAGTRAAKLTSQLLAFSRKQLIQPRLLNLNEVISSITNLLKPLLGNSIEVLNSLSANIENIQADAGQLEQVLMNLAFNARDAMPKGGKLLFETKCINIKHEDDIQGMDLSPGSYVQLCVSDTGDGMDSHTLHRVFEPFYTTKPTGKGTGLGLSIVHGIVRQSNGDIRAHSTPGLGTRFEIFFPAVPSESHMAVADQNSKQTGKKESGGEYILVVEDEPALRKIIVKTLENAGYRVCTAEDAPEAEKLIEDKKPVLDMLLTDVGLPRISGTELSASLSKIYPHLVTLYMSGFTEDLVFKQALQKPETFFLTKPFSADDLRKKIRQVLDAR